MGFYSLVSLSNDGDLQDRLLRSRGFRTVRGSSGRGGARALLELTRKLQEGGVMAHTPDGPKGPPKKVQPGTVYLAKRSGCPVLPVGVACRPCKRLGSWDSHMLPVSVRARGDLLRRSAARFPAMRTMTDAAIAHRNRHQRSRAARVGEHRREAAGGTRMTFLLYNAAAAPAEPADRAVYTLARAGIGQVAQLVAAATRQGRTAQRDRRTRSNLDSCGVGWRVRRERGCRARTEAGAAGRGCCDVHDDRKGPGDGAQVC